MIILLPLFVAKSTSQYNHRDGGTILNEANLKNPIIKKASTVHELCDINFKPVYYYYVRKNEVNIRLKKHLNNKITSLLTFHDIARSTDKRTFISSIIPVTACGNTLPILLTTLKNQYLLASMFNSFCFDYICRCKIQSTHINKYILQQLPVIPPETFEQEWEGTKLADFVKEQVLRLSYTAWDMEPFARAMGYEGDPFTWDPEDRLHRQCKLDALFMLLYEIAEDDAAYILETFPIVKKKDMEKYGRYRTQELILGYMRALRVCDFEVSLDL